MSIYLILVLVFLAAAWAVEMVVARLDLAALGQGLPREFEDVYDQEKYQQSQRYARANQRLHMLEQTVELVAVAGFILARGFNALDLAARATGRGPIVTGLVFFAALSLLSGALSLPFSIYRTFVIEARFGFNTTTWGVFLADRLKGAALAALIGGPLLALVLAFLTLAGPLAWVWAWAAVTAVSLAVQYLAPTLILPLFNRFTPLAQGEARQAILAYAQAQGMALSGIFVMDGSRRSRKANAFFTGFGRLRRIVLFDTLLDAHPPDQIVAVLAHETGHRVLGHIPWLTASAVARTGLMFWLLSLFLGNAELFAAFGMAHVSVHAGLVFFGLLYTPLALVLGVGANALSRRFEYQADAFAARTTGNAEAMAQALKTLSAANLSNLTPHPAQVALHHAHPPVLARIRALRATA